MNQEYKTLGDRMKAYENQYRLYLPKKRPVIIRIDGKAFHTFTRGFEEPFDEVMRYCMAETARTLCASIQNCKIAYTQSDEISLLLYDNAKTTTCAWFDNNIQKMASVAASIATVAFNEAYMVYTRVWDLDDKYQQKTMKAMFDARVFSLDPDEVNNYFIWRQQDAIRNSVQAVAQSLFYHKELQKKNTAELKEMILSKGQDWNKYPICSQRGFCIVKRQFVKDGAIRSSWEPDYAIPNFVEDRAYINIYLNIEGEN